MTSPSLLPAGRELSAWIKAGGNPDRASRANLWLYRWRAFWLERSYQLLRHTGPAASKFPFPDGEGLVFIQGFWRAGTTLLHELLSDLPQCATPRTWQCMDPSVLLSPAAQPRTSQAIQRPMDEIIITTDSPQEDEFALMSMGVPSVYQGFLDPRRLQDLKPLLQSSFWNDTHSDWGAVFEAFIAWCATPQQTHMVVKSPNHIFRTPALMTRYPRARYVWIFRDPEDLWRSNMKMWRAMIDRYSLWKAPEGALEDFLESALESYCVILESMHEQAIFRDQVVFSYESLANDPQRMLPKLIDQLELGPWSGFDEALRAQLLSRPRASKSVSTRDDALQVLSRTRKIQDAILQSI